MKSTLSMLAPLLFGMALAIQAGHVQGAEWDPGWWDDDDIEMFESDNFLEDDYGAYDEDFDWDVADEEFDDWAEDVEDDWQEWNEPDDGLLDV